MTFLAPWALGIGGLAAAGAVLLHLVARQRPAAYLLPTTRFIPSSGEILPASSAGTIAPTSDIQRPNSAP